MSTKDLHNQTILSLANRLNEITREILKEVE